MSESLTIAQALRRVKKLKGLIAEHQIRAKQGVSYVSDKVPAFRFAEEVAAIARATEELVGLESRIAVANATAIVCDDGVNLSLAKAIRILQETKGMITFYQGLCLREGTEKNRESDWDDNENKSITRITEIVYISDLSEQERDRKVKLLQNRFEALNNLVEDANHKVLV